MVVCGMDLCCFFLTITRPPRSTRSDPPLPYSTLFRSGVVGDEAAVRRCQRIGGGAGTLLRHPLDDVGRRITGGNAILRLELHGAGDDEIVDGAADHVPAPHVLVEPHVVGITPRELVFGEEPEVAVVVEQGVGCAGVPGSGTDETGATS